MQGERKRITGVLNHLFAECDGSVEHNPGNVRSLAEGWISNYVDIGESGDAQGIAKTCATRAFDVAQYLQLARETKPGVERLDSGSRVVLARRKAILSGIFSRKAVVLLTDEIRLGGNPEATPKRVGFRRRRGGAALGKQRPADDTEECQ